MPIYEYRCEECQQLFEEWCKHVEDESILHACPICKGDSKRIMSHTSFALKGGGWYVTEYGSRKNDSAQGTKNCTTQKDAASASSAAPAESSAPSSPCASGGCAASACAASSPAAAPAAAPAGSSAASS